MLDRADSPLGIRAAAELWVKKLCIEPAQQILDVLNDVDPDVWFVHPSAYRLTEMAFPRIVRAANSGTDLGWTRLR